MSKKHIVLKEGFYVDNRDIKKCHFGEATTIDSWDDKSDGYIVMIDGAVKIVSGHKKELFTNYPDAVQLLNTRQEAHIKYHENQLEYHKESLSQARVI